MRMNLNNLRRLFWFIPGFRLEPLSDREYARLKTYSEQYHAAQTKESRHRALFLFETCYKALKDKDTGAFDDFVVQARKDMANYREKLAAEKEARKNHITEYKV